MHALNFVSHGFTSKQGIKIHQKDNKGKGKSKKPKTSILSPRNLTLRENAGFAKSMGIRRQIISSTKSG